MLDLLYIHAPKPVAAPSGEHKGATGVQHIRTDRWTDANYLSTGCIRLPTRDATAGKRDEVEIEVNCQKRVNGFCILRIGELRGL